MILQRNKPMRVSARAIIIRNGELLVFFRRRFDLKKGRTIEYYSIPGGGVDAGETLEEAVVRELYEEMAVRVKPRQKVAIIESNDRRHHIYWTAILEGEPMFNPASQEYRMQNKFNSYEVRWVDIDTLDGDMFMWGFEQLIPIIKNISLGMNITKARLFSDK